MKKIKYIVLLSIIIFSYFKYKDLQIYDADNPEASLNIMIKLTNPLERGNFLQDFSTACDDQQRCVNLHGLDRKQIHNTALSKNKR